MVGNCTFLGTQIYETGVHFSNMYQNLTFGQVAESVIFNLLSNALEYRYMTLKIQKAETEGNNPQILEESISFIWSTIWFENVYYAFDQSELNVASPRQFEQVNLESYRKKGGARKPKVATTFNYTYEQVGEEYDTMPYKFWFGIMDRYADYFEYYSET